MTHEMYWLDVDGDRTGLEIFVNGIPVDRMLRTFGLKLPINEFVVIGTNRVEVRRSVWPANLPDNQGGKISAKLLRARFDGTAKLDETILFDQEATFVSCAPRQPLFTATFAAAAALATFGVYDPVGPHERELILGQLAEVAALWQRGDGAALAQWMHSYFEDYAAAYPLETVQIMGERIAGMAQAFKIGLVDFNREATVLEPIAGSNLIDCIGPRGAAVRIIRPKGPDYDMWAVVGVRNGQVRLVR